MAAEHAAFVLNVAEAIAERDRALRRVLRRRLAHLRDEIAHDVLAAVRAGVEHGEVLREPLAQPLLVVVLPADRLAPPLVRDFVRQKQMRVDVLERDRILRPRKRRRRQRLQRASRNTAGCVRRAGCRRRAAIVKSGYGASPTIFANARIISLARLTSGRLFAAVSGVATTSMLTPAGPRPPRPAACRRSPPPARRPAPPPAAARPARTG